MSLWSSVVLCGPLWSSVHLTSWVPRSACFWETNLAPKQKMLQWQHEKLVRLGWSSSPSRALQVSQSRSCTSDYDLKFKQCLSRCCPTCGANKKFNQNIILGNNNHRNSFSFKCVPILNMRSYPWVKGEMMRIDLTLRRIQIGTRSHPDSKENGLAVPREGNTMEGPVWAPGSCQTRAWSGLEAVEPLGICDVKIGKNSHASWAPIASKNWMLCAGKLWENCGADTGPSPPQTLRVRAEGQNDPPAASKPGQRESSWRLHVRVS
jgi:hypothetical protein